MLAISKRCWSFVSTWFNYFQYIIWYLKQASSSIGISSDCLHGKNHSERLQTSCLGVTWLMLSANGARCKMILTMIPLSWTRTRKSIIIWFFLFLNPITSNSTHTDLIMAQLRLKLLKEEVKQVPSTDNPPHVSAVAFFQKVLDIKEWLWVWFWFLTLLTLTDVYLDMHSLKKRRWRSPLPTAMPRSLSSRMWFCKTSLNSVNSNIPSCLVSLPLPMKHTTMRLLRIHWNSGSHLNFQQGNRALGVSQISLPSNFTFATPRLMTV